jgi:hypothetical protein
MSSPNTSSSQPIPKVKKVDTEDKFYTPPNQIHFPEKLRKQEETPNLSTVLEELQRAQTEEAPENVNDIVLSKEDIFVNLTLLSKIEVGDKLVRSRSDKHLNIDTSYLQFITRWFKGNSRNTSLQFINLVLTKAFEINDKLLHEKTDIAAQSLFRLTSDLKNALNGLNNLKQTYSFDKLIQSEIDVMIDNVRSKLDYNSQNIKFL